MLNISYRILMQSVALVVLTATPVSAQITIDFAAAADFSAPVAFNGVEGGDPAVPIVMTVGTDAVGQVDPGATTITSNKTNVSDLWTISGVSAAGTDQMLSFTVRSPLDPVNQRHAGGIGINGGNPGRIDRTTEFLDFQLDLSSVPNNLQFQLLEIGFANANAIRTADPDLVVTDFTGQTTTFENFRSSGGGGPMPSGTLSVEPGDVALTGGATGLFRFSQSQEGEFPEEFVGYSLASITFDFVSVEINLDGDYNDDGVVDAADYTVWRNNLGSAITLPNDPTPGSVTAGDYEVWKNNFGAGATLPAALEISQIPEPAAALLVLCLVAAVSLAGRFRQA